MDPETPESSTETVTLRTPDSVETIKRVLIDSCRGIRERISRDDLELSEEIIAGIVNFSRSAALVANFMESHKFPASGRAIREALLELGDALDRAILGRAYNLNRNLSESIRAVLGEEATDAQRATLDRGMELLIRNAEQAAARAKAAGYDDYVEKFLALIGQGRKD